VHRSSETIGTIAAALAKAQAQLVNPEKSLVGTIPSSETSGPERSFRYAPLSTGLDIVRKTLSQHEIATVQTTSIDEAVGIVRLSTVLAHASGEWIASDWPVCAISNTEAPHRMGAALTYARRYALFALVGIAGEDDLDAPDLIAPKTPTSTTEKPTANKKGRLNGGQKYAAHQTTGTHGARTVVRPSNVLESKPSAALRDQLMAELKDLNSAEEAANWAYRVLGAKNTLITPDAERIERAFREQLEIFAAANESQAARETKRRPSRRGKTRQQSAAIDKSVLTLPAPRRVRDRDHVKFVAKQACLICGRRPADTHHLRFAQLPALGSKVSDEFTVPLCRGHHREAHRCGDEAAWWVKAGVDPTVSARALWLKTHPLPAMGDISSSDNAPLNRVIAGLCPTQNLINHLGRTRERVRIGDE
jgi:ERF superfamily